MTTFKVTSKFANRGKRSEDAMAKFLNLWAFQSPNREVNRLVDSKAAGRIIKSAAADFEFFCPDGHGLIEVKETEHEYRLARDKVPQLARLRKRTNCGGAGLVAVFHSTTKLWRVVSAPYLMATGDKGSWNLSSVAAHGDLATAMAEEYPGVFE